MKEKNTIYILLTYSGSLLSKCINIYTKEPYTHVSIALDINLNELYSFGRLNPSNPIFAGFVKEDIFNGTYARFPNTRCALYSLEVNDIQYNKLKKELQKFKLNKHRYGYNLLGLFGVIFNKPPALVSPRDFRKCKELELVYEGRLKRYSYRQEYLSEVYQ